MLRCIQIGLSMDDLRQLEMGTVLDLLTESGNDDAEWHTMATQEDFDRF